MEDDLSLFGDVIMRQSQSPVPGPSHLNETLRFDNGGYGGAHYSPTGSILRGWEPAEPSVFAASPSPENVVFDASTPVAIIVWLDVSIFITFVNYLKLNVSPERCTIAWQGVSSG